MDERFPLCSTFKLPLAAVVLREVDIGRFRLSDTIGFSQKDMVPFAPVTSVNLAKGGMTVGALAGKAAIIVAAYFDTDTRSPDIRDEDQAVLAEVGRIAATWATS